MLIKASRITSLTDARYFAAKNVQFLGFNLEMGTPGYLDPMYMRAIREWVQGPLIVGEYATTPVAEVREAATFFGLDAVQVTADYLPELVHLATIPILLAVDADQEVTRVEALFRQAAPYVEHFIVQVSAKNNVESSFGDQAEFWKSMCAQHSVLLHWDGMPGDLPTLLDIWPLAGLSLMGGNEQQVGVKSFAEMEEIFDWLEEQ